MTRWIPAVAIVVLAGLLWPASARAQCRANEILVDEDADNYYCNRRNDRQIANAAAVHDAARRGDLPPFEPLWDHYQHNRDVARGLAPEQNRCAIVLSMTLGLVPRAGEKTLRDLGAAQADILGRIRGKLVIPELAGAQLATRYYVRAQELGDRLRRQWGPPQVIDGASAERTMRDRKGVVFFKDAYLGDGGEPTIDHIDVWNGRRLGSLSSAPFQHAREVWFWETPD